MPKKSTIAGEKPRNIPVCQARLTGTMLGRLPWIILLPVFVFASACKGGEEPSTVAASQITPNAPGSTEPNSTVYNPVKPGQKPSFVVSGKFESGVAKLEVLGICKLSEDGVQCWNATGQKDPALSAKVSEGLKPISLSSGITGAYTMHYGLKNRLLIFKTESGSSPYDPKIGSYEIGGKQQYGSSYVSLKGMTDRNVLGSQNNLHAAMIAEAKDAKTTFIDFVFNEPVRENVELACKQGEQARIAGVDLKLSGWQAMPQGQWYVQIDADIASLKGINVAFKPLDAQGKPFEYSDKDGNPVSQAEFDQLSQEERALLHHATEPPAVKLKNGFQVRLSIDPAKVGSFAVYALRTKQGRIEKIPLDAR